MGFAEISFDDNIKDLSKGVGFVIRDAEDRLLAAGSFFLHEPSVLETELRTI